MKNIFNSVFIICLLFFCSSVVAQSRYFEWMNLKIHSRERIDLSNSNHLREVQVGRWEKIGTISLDTNVLFDLPTKFSTKFFHSKRRDVIFFTVSGTGKVYQYDQTKKLLSRLDRTYFKGYNFDAPQFLRNDTIYNFGGFGFWTYSKILTYYDSEIQEWQEIRPENFGPDSFIEGYQGYSKQNDIFYSGGAEIETGLKKFNRVFKDELFAFDFKSLKWRLLGKINPVLPFKSVRNVFWDGIHFIHLSPDKMFIIDPVKNEVLMVVNPKYLPLRNFYAAGDSIIAYWDNHSKQVKLSKRELLKEASYVGKFYEDKDYRIYGFFFGGLIILIIGTIVYFRSKRPKRHLADSINKTYQLGALERLLLKKLIEAEEQPGKFISVLQINEILNLGAKTPENQRRIRTKFLSELNFKLLVNFQVQDAIERFQFEEDKRLTVYRLKHEVKQAIINKLY